MPLHPRKDKRNRVFEDIRTEEREHLPDEKVLDCTRNMRSPLLAGNGDRHTLPSLPPVLSFDLSLTPVLFLTGSTPRARQQPKHNKKRDEMPLSLPRGADESLPSESARPLPSPGQRKDQGVPYKHAETSRILQARRACPRPIHPHTPVPNPSRRRACMTPLLLVHVRCALVAFFFFSFRFVIYGLRLGRSAGVLLLILGQLRVPLLRRLLQLRVRFLEAIVNQHLPHRSSGARACVLVARHHRSR